MPNTIIIKPLELISGLLKTILPIMYRISMYINPVKLPVSQPLSLLFRPLTMLAVKILSSVIKKLAGVITEYGTDVYVIRKEKIKNKIADSI